MSGPVSVKEKFCRGRRKREPDQRDLQASVPAVALARLIQECERLTREQFGYVSYGQVLARLIMQHLPPAPGEK